MWTASAGDRPQAFRYSCTRVTKGFSRPHYVVNPRLERRRNSKVVHRRSQNDLVCFDQFGNQFIGKRECFLVACIVLFGRRVCASNPVEVDEREVGLGQNLDR